MSERTERLTQRIPAAVIAPADQVALAASVVQEVCGLPECSPAGAERIAAALADLDKSLVILATAGVLVGLSLTFREGEEAASAVILLDRGGVGELEEADFSALRLLVGPEAEPALEIICEECALARKLVDRLLPTLAAETLACAQLRWQTEEPEPDLPAGDESEHEDEDEGEGEWDEYDDDIESRG